MAELVGSILLKFGLGFISDKFRTYGAETLQDGGLTDQKFRGLIVRELDDIKFKLDGLSRKDLSASISFLKQGIQRLQTCFEFGNSSTSKLPTYGRDLIDTASTGPSSGQTKPVQLQSVSVEDAVALANAIGKLKIESNERFESAKESFKKAGEEATRAFHNTGLSTNERILATEVRIASAILENLEDPCLAATDCLHYLEELHAMPAIKDIFSVHIQGGIKNFFKKDSRAQIVETVTTINLMLADFITKFTKRRMGILDWPMIECSKRVVHPIHYQEESVRKLKKMKITPPWDIVKTASLLSYPVAMTSKGEEIYINRRNCFQKYDRATGLCKFFSFLSSPKFLLGFSIAIDDNDTVYIVWINYEFKYILSVYSSDGKHTHSCPLDFIHKIPVGMTVTKEKNIVFCTDSIYECTSASTSVSLSVYVCDISGKLIKSFPSLVENVLAEGIYLSLDNSADNITIVAYSCSSKATMLFMFTQEGKLKRTINLHSHYYWQPLYQWRCFTTFDHVTKNYVCAKRDYRDYEVSLECFSETGELRNALFLDAEPGIVRVVSHSNGAMFILYRSQIYHLRSPRV